LIVAGVAFREGIISSREIGVDTIEKKTMKLLRIPLVIVLLVLAGRAFNANAQTETNLYSFAGPPNDDGRGPYARLVQGNDGNFYGTTFYGGTNLECGGEGCGTVFRISPSGSETNLHSFGAANDGSSPVGGLVQGSDGNFYGTTFFGGTYSYGTVFRINPSSSYTSLYSFVGSPNDGAYSEAGLVQGSDSNFYGTTYSGGTYSYGTVFRINPSGSYTSLYSFVGSPDGSQPYAGLVQGSDGNFDGTTEHGGTHGSGTVFRISSSGTYTSLYSFGSVPNDGSQPQAGLVQGSDGNFYGTTQDGGTHGSGTVFRISSSGTYTNLYSFGSVTNDGVYSEAGLVQGSDGNFYGTTEFGGTSTNSLCGGRGCGTVFRISPSGTNTTLYSFAGPPTDGNFPYAGLVQGSDGNFDGTTYGGGTNNEGIVFKLTVPLSPPPYPINQITGVHLAATNIIFSIPSIAGETYQLQFSSSMKPTNWVNVSGVSVTNSIGSILTLTNFGGASTLQRFYRFAITP
jgi:uncharacterized repeat protein (TIGR03803 family)